MRIRLQLLLPLLFGLLVASGFLLAGALVGAGIREALLTVPGLTRERAVEAAARAVGIGGVVATVLAVVAGALVARMVAAPLARLQRTTAHLAERDADPEPDTPLAEIQDVARGIAVAAGELRARQERTRRERSELAALVEAVSEGIIQVDREGRIARLNRSAARLLGLPADAAGQPVAALFRSPTLRDLMEQAVGGQGTGAADVVLDDRRMLVTASPQPGGGAVATFVDLTDLRRLEEVRRDFVANASHELKTPLTSIRGYTETLMAGGLPAAERDRFLATIARNAERLQHIVDDLLDLSRLEAGRWQPELAPVSVAGAAETCWAGFADRAAERRVRFRLDPAGPDTALADRQGLDQVFANLFDNALRHTQGEGTVTVRTRLEPAPPPGRDEERRLPGSRPAHPGPWLVAEVADTGLGIPRDALPRIFERFYRVDPARSRVEGGTGLGLSIVRHMIEGMGGGVDARSELGKGTTVRFWLPAPG